MAGTPHDALFKAVFARPEHARGALRAALPKAFADALDWSSLARSPGSFVDEELREQHTDLLFTVPLRSGGEALVYLLFEHQSTADRQMAYRLLRYVVRIWERWKREHPQATTLPAIVPIVLYHGATAWSAPRSLEALIDLPPHVAGDVRAFVPQLSFLVDDLSTTPDRELRGRAMTALATLAVACFKHARTGEDLVATLATWADLFREVVQARDGLEALAHLVRYAMLVSDHVDTSALEELLEREIGPEGKETVVTLGQRLIEQGIERGRLAERRSLLLRLLAQRFGSAVDADVEQRVGSASLEELERWVEGVLTVTSLDELFGSG